MNRISYESKKLMIALLVSAGLSGLLAFVAKIDSNWVEFIYSREIYPYITNAVTRMSEKWAISLGEFFLIILLLVILFLVLFMFKYLSKRNWRKSLRLMMIIGLILSLNLLAFQVGWGLNNYRLPLEKLMQLNHREISAEDLYGGYVYLIQKANETRKQIYENGLTISDEYIYANAYSGFEKLHEEYEFISGEPVRVKPLLTSPIFSKSGYTGIFLPFYSEPNINDMAHITTRIFSACHEIAHQKGFARENEANFLAYLSGINHESLWFQYSAYLSMSVYIGNALYQADQHLYEEAVKGYASVVMKDLEERRAFWNQHIVEEVRVAHDEINDRFLQANNQPQGTAGYSSVTGLFMLYYMKMV